MNLKDKKSFTQIVIIVLDETLSGKLYVTFQIIRHFLPPKFRPIRYDKVILSKDRITLGRYTIIFGYKTQLSEASIRGRLLLGRGFYKRAASIATSLA